MGALGVENLTGARDRQEVIPNITVEQLAGSG
ncbi:hypothetical protein EVA_15709, partial [gut metagenome]